MRLGQFQEYSRQDNIAITGIHESDDANLEFTLVHI